MTILCIFPSAKNSGISICSFFESFLPVYSDQSLRFTTVKPHRLFIRSKKQILSLLPMEIYLHFEAYITT